MESEQGIRLISLTPSGRDVRIELSNGEILELAAESLPPALSVGDRSLAPDLLRELRDAAQRKRISRHVFNLIDRRLLPRRRILDKLSEKGFDRDLGAQVLEKFAEQGLVSDRIYAEAWCRDTLRAKAVGRMYLISRLIKKGVSGDLASDVAGDILPPEAEREAVGVAARKWWARQGGDTDPRTLARGMRHLQGRGFPAALAADAVRREAPGKGDRT